jgi:Rad3-related DNA helicase
MNANGVQDRNGKLAEYLELLHSLAQELERSMQAISQNSLVPLEDSVANQQVLATRLHELAHDLSKPVRNSSAPSTGNQDEGLMREVRSAADTLQSLNQRYSALLKLSSHSVGLMVSLFSSFRGQIQEGTGPRLKHQTWSCQV